MIQVKATREGEYGKATASGYVVDKFVAFVALPSRRALHRHVRLVNPALPDLFCYAQVLDVGPWNGGTYTNPKKFTINTDDDSYVFGGQRPQAETGKDLRGRVTNGAGIDLSDFVWRALGMTDNGPVQWEFLA